MRIISTVPSITELLSDLHLEEEVVGITKFCVHPETWFRSKTRIGGTKNLHIETIHELKPDLIICNKEENTKEQIEALSEYETYVTEVKTLEDNLDLIESVGQICGVIQKANALKNKFEAVAESLYSPVFTKALYFIWNKPLMTVGGDTYIHSMMQHLGIENATSDLLRYPEMTEDQIRQSSAQNLLFSSEPFPFKEKHINQYKKIFPGQEGHIVDGELFSWYGSRLIKMEAYARRLQQQLGKLLPEQL